MRKVFCLLYVAVFVIFQAFSQGIIVDHRSTDLTKIPSEAINAAKTKLHIAYGHTSHGSQITDGMSGLVNFTGGKGGPQFDWNNGGSNGALDLHDYAMDGDCGYYPQWVDNTRAFLDNPANANVNVIIWSWCGQISTYSEADLVIQYIEPMCQLEKDYPAVKFVYMTGHHNYDLYANTKARNQQLRDFCSANNKILYDFNDIESYDPDGVYYPYATDACDYYADINYSYLGNWAQKWQDSHREGIDWYNCESAHSQPLNANQKAYAAWHLWARLSGWQPTANSTVLEQIPQLISVYPNPSSQGKFTIEKGNIRITGIDIYTETGSKVFSISDIKLLLNNEIDLSCLMKGIYFVRLFTDDGAKIYSEKIIKL